MKNILIVGSNGLLGRSLSFQLSKNYTVFGISREKIDVNEKSDDIIIHLQKDLSSFNFNLFPENIDVLYYLAQSNKFRDFPDGVSDMLKVNIHAPLKIADWAVKKGVKKFIYASSGGVYRKPDKPVKEFFDNANERNGFYLDSKLSAGNFTQKFC